jgi:adenylyl-sulfate kinase
LVVERERSSGELSQPGAQQRGFTVWLTGLSGAGKSTLADALAPIVQERFGRVEVLDGDVVRTNLSKGLGFSKEDRDTNIQRIAFVANLLTRNGVPVIVAAISPYRQARDEARALIGNFIEVYVDCPVDELIRRDTKGLYGKALQGELPMFTGISDVYEPPLAPEVVVHTDREPAGRSMAKILDALEERGLLPVAASSTGRGA